MEAVRQALARMDQPAALVVAGEANRRYLSGFRGDAGLLWITADDAALITDSRFWDQAGQECPEWRLVRQRRQPQGDVLAGLVAEAGVRGLAFDPGEVSHQTYLDWRRRLRGVRMRGARGWVDQLRVHKDAGEVAAIGRAAALVDVVFAEWRPQVRPGAVEAELAADLEWRLRRAGAEGIAFPTIVAGGARGAQPHAIAGPAALAAGDLVVVDVGARVDGYCSDMTRTLLVPGAPPPPEAGRVYGIVAEALAAGLAALRPGVRAQAVDAACRQVIEAAGFGEEFGHGTGHGVGLDVHEDPPLSPRAGPGVRVPAGAVVTVEPGIYLPGRWGVRLEQLVHVTADGPRVLSASQLEW